MPVPVRTAIALCVAALGCGGGGSTGPAPIESVTVTIAQPSLAIGDQTTASATAKDASGNVLSGRQLNWSSSNFAVATVEATGVVHAIDVGTAVISATSEGRSGTATVTVPGFGSSREKIKIVDIGGVFTPTLSGSSSGTTTLVSRAPTVATVNAQGTITGVGEGQVWVVATAPGWAPDSVYVIVPRTSTGPVLRTDLTTFNVAAGSTIVFDVILDTRSTPIGGTQFSFGFTTTPPLFTDGSASTIGTPAPVVSNPQLGVLRVSLASGSRLAGELAILRLTFTVRAARTSGFLTLTLIDLVSPTGTDLMPVSTSTRIPIIVQ